MRAKKLLCVLLAAAVCMTAAACGGKEKRTVAPSTVVLNDFERYDTCFAPCIIGNYFGRVTMNKDGRYVRSGAASAKLEPIGDATRTSGLPALRMPLNLEKKGLDARDFSNVEMIEASFFNTSAEPIEAGMYLSYSGGTMSAVQKTLLQPNVWTTAYYIVDRTTLDFMTDITAIQRLNFEFPVATDETAPPVVYLDDVILHLNNEPFDTIDMQFAENEALNFNESWALFALETNAGDTTYLPELSVNTQPEFSQSGNSLKLTYSGNRGDVSTWAYADFRVTQKVLQASGFTTRPDADSFEFDVYNPESRRIRLFIEATNSNSKLFFKTELYCEPQAWTTASYTFGELNDGRPADYTGSHQGSGRVAAGGGTESIAYIRISWDYYSEPAGMHSLYFDAFRYVTATAEI